MASHFRVQIEPLCPADAVPESVADVVLGKSDQGYLADLLLFQGVHGKYYHGLADAPHPVIPVDAYMIETAPASVVAAEDAAYHLAVFDGHHAGGGVPF